MSTPKEIGMSTGAVEGAMFTVNFVYKEPIGFQVQFPALSPCALQRMIIILNWQWSFRKQKADGSFQLFHIFSAFLAFFDITPKLRGIDRGKHLYAHLLEKVFRNFGVKYILAAIRFFHSYPRQFIRLRVGERQTPLMGDSRQRHSAYIGYRQSHSSEYPGGFILYRRINPGTNKITGRHGLSPCLHYA
jgi:hypothetical protein